MVFNQNKTKLYDNSTLKEELVNELLDFVETDYFLGALYELFEYSYIESFREELIDNFVKEPEIFTNPPAS